MAATFVGKSTVSVAVTCPALGEEPRRILRPRKTNRTWHLDPAVVTRLGRRFHVAALLDLSDARQATRAGSLFSNPTQGRRHR